MISIILIFAFIALTSCAGRNAAPGKPDGPVEVQLDKVYENIVVSEFNAASDIKEDYPDAASECQASMISALLMKNVYKSITVQGAETVFKDRTLLVKVEIKEMRIVSWAARFWLGAMVGSSYMDMDIMLIDAVTKKEVRKKELNTSNNAWAAAWVMGSSDRSLPSDMGKIIAEYILSVVPHA
jgi:hypothetical protein